MYFTIPLLFDIQVNSNFCSGCVGGGVCVCVCVRVRAPYLLLLCSDLILRVYHPNTAMA